MTNVCNECVHNKVCRLKNVCERISKKLDDSLDITTDKKESFEVGQFEVKLYCKDFEEITPKIRQINLNDISLSEQERIKKLMEQPLDVLPKVPHPCEGCPTYEMLKDGKIYVGDLPCQWCDKNPMRATWNGRIETITTTTGTNKEYNCNTCPEAFRNGVPCPHKIGDCCSHEKKGK